MIYKRILLTGAAGNLGQVLRTSLASEVETLVSTDIQPMDNRAANEVLIQADLTCDDVVHKLVEDVDAIVHFGGISTEADFDAIESVNIKGTQRLYEAARTHGIKRIVFASSNHAVGFHDQCEVIDTRAPLRPDTFYGLSKAFGENLAQLYWDKHGIETVSLRIGSCIPRPLEPRHLLTWLSYRDLCQLVKRSLSVPRVKHTIIYGISNNDGAFWDNRYAAHLGYTPEDRADDYRESLELTETTMDRDSPSNRYQGGNYTL